MAMAQPMAMSAALPVASWCTAKEQLMPAPLTALPCSYNRRTDGPMPCIEESHCQAFCVLTFLLLLATLSHALTTQPSLRLTGWLQF